MSSNYDYNANFSFRKPNNFYVHLNKQMIIKDRDTLNDDSLYHLLFFSALPLDFNDCIDEDGCLKTGIDVPTGMTKIEASADTYTDVPFHLGVEWINNGESGFNLFLDETEDVEIPFKEGEEFYFKGVALAKITGTETGGDDYIVAFARQPTPVRCQNYVTIMKGSSFVGQSSCEEL